MTRITVRQARSTFATILNAGEPTLVGDLYHIRALIIPITSESIYHPANAAKVLRKAQAAANSAFRELRTNCG